jgi:hypothetical protein
VITVVGSAAGSKVAMSTKSPSKVCFAGSSLLQRPHLERKSGYCACSITTASQNLCDSCNVDLDIDDWNQVDRSDHSKSRCKATWGLQCMSSANSATVKCCHSRRESDKVAAGSTVAERFRGLWPLRYHLHRDCLQTRVQCLSISLLYPKPFLAHVRDQGSRPVRVGTVSGLC